MTKLLRNDQNLLWNEQNENKNGYEMMTMERNDLGTKWPGYEMTGNHAK